VVVLFNPFLLGDGQRVRALALAAAAALVEFRDPLPAAVEHQHVTRLRHVVTVRGALIAAVRSLDAKDEDALVAQPELAERPAGDPVVGLDLQLVDRPAAADVQQAGVVARLHVGEALQHPLDHVRHHALDDRAAGDQPEHDQPADDDRDPAEGRTAAAEGDHQRPDDRDDADVAAPHQPHRDLAPDGVGDDRLGLRGGEADAEERRARLEARGLPRHPGEHERRARDADDHDAHQHDDDDGQRGTHATGLPARNASQSFLAWGRTTTADVPARKK
jgi:hypothetical protein